MGNIVIDSLKLAIRMFMSDDVNIFNVYNI